MDSLVSPFDAFSDISHLFIKERNEVESGIYKTEIH